MGEKRPTAFVSYAQSSRPWQETVLDFTAALRNPGGVEAEMDLFHDVDHQRWATFGPNLIEASDFTLIAVDAAYRRRWLGREERGVGAGVAREAAAIRAIYERDQEEFLKRIKLVLLPGVGEEDVPGDLLGECERFAIASFDLDGLEGLLRSIYGRPAFPKPDLSPIPTLPPKAIARLEPIGPVETPRKPKPATGDPGRAATEVDARDAENLRGQLDRIRGELRGLPGKSVDPSTRDALLREETVIEVSLGALRTSARRSPRRRSRAPSRRSRAENGRRLLMAGLALVTVTSAAASLPWLLSPIKSDREASARPITARASGVELEAPPGWRQQAGRAGLTGLEIPAPVSLTPGQRLRHETGDMAAVAGISGATGAKLLPVAYREQLGEGTERTAVDLGSLDAYRYSGLETDGGDPLVVYVAPSSIGVVTLACRMPARADGAARRLCAGIAGTLRLSRGDPYPLGPSAAFAKAMRRQFKGLEGRQQAALSSMTRAKRSEGQAIAATKAAEAYRGAARHLGSIRITPESEGGRASIVAALSRIRDGYERLAAAAREEDQSAYVAGRREIRAGQREARQRLSELRSLGYRVRAKASRG